MKTAAAHESECIVRPDATVIVEGVPFAAGEKVRVILIREEIVNGRRHSDAEIATSKSLRVSLRGSVVRYDDPTEPVGVDDWEALRDGEGGPWAGT